MNVKVKPIVLKNEETNEEYTLEFNRESIKRAESLGFNIEELATKPATMIPLFFYCSFWMHHKNTVSQQKAERILYEDLGGINEKIAERLTALYEIPLSTLIQDDEPKNSKMTVTM